MRSTTFEARSAWALAATLLLSGCGQGADSAGEGAPARLGTAQLALSSGPGWIVYPSTDPVQTGPDHTATPYFASVDGILLVGGLQANGGARMFLGDAPQNAGGGLGGLGFDWMTHPRTRHSTTVLNGGDVLVAGGTVGHVISNAERLTASWPNGWRVWTHSGHLAVPRQWHTATLLPTGYVLMAGGDDGNGAALSSAELYTGGWAPTGSMSSKRRWHTATRLPNGSVLVAGGDDGTGPLASAELYSGTWSQAAPMSAARRWHTATLLANGKVLVAGGDGGAGALASAEIYDPAANGWSPAAALGTARARHRDLLLGGGAVLVTGGEDGATAFASTELYDPSADAWSAGLPMNAARAAHAMAQSAKGWIIVAGGEAGGAPVTGLERLIPGNTALGVACAVDGDCASGFCVSGVCCDRSCDLQCSVCASGSGVCTPTAEGATCSIQSCGASPATCVSGACTSHPLPHTCALGFLGCATGSGQCVAGLGCFVSTEPDNGLPYQSSVCVDGYGYMAGLPSGASCPPFSDNFCLSGHCASTAGSVCCDQPCTGPCQTCSVAGGGPEDGVCSPLTGVACNNGGTCMAGGSCEAGVCLGSSPVADGTACLSGNLCTHADSCQGGVCVGHSFTVCPADQCHTAGTCNPLSGTCSSATSKPNGAACDDGNACTQSDTCQTGVCTGQSPVVCAPLDQCHATGACDPTTGACSNPARPNGAACNDGNACTAFDTCQGGACTGQPPESCAPLDQCHAAGFCDPTIGMCTNPVMPDGTACDDGNACTQSDTCRAGACTGQSPVACGPLDQCHVAGACDPTTGACSSPIKPDGSACDDGNACTQTDLCKGGTCTGGLSVTCSAADACHVAGACDPQSGVCSTPAAPDGTPCGGGTCSAGTCLVPPDAGPGDAGSGAGGAGGAAATSTASSSSTGGTTTTTSSSSTGGTTTTTTTTSSSGTGGASSASTSTSSSSGAGGAAATSTASSSGTGGAAVTSTASSSGTAASSGGTGGAAASSTASSSGAVSSSTASSGGAGSTGGGPDLTGGCGCIVAEPAPGSASRWLALALVGLTLRRRRHRKG